MVSNIIKLFFPILCRMVGLLIDLNSDQSAFDCDYIHNDPHD